jgi:hypothetical protein
MFVLLSLVVIDWLLPAVSVPAFGWALIVCLYVAYKAVGEAKRTDPKPIKKKQPEKIFTEHEWIVNPRNSGIYSTPDAAWQLVTNQEGDAFWLLGEGEQAIDLTASTLGAAMDQADMIISTLTPEGK